MRACLGLAFCTVLGPLGRLWARVGPLGPSWGDLECLLGRRGCCERPRGECANPALLGRLLEASWGVSGTSWPV
eukprot:5516663-Pyramimonas_sp.AAC.1